MHEILSIDTMFYYAPLQALSKRIHYGKVVAEAKFQECPYVYEDAIKVKVRIYFSYNILPPF
jgi:chorismate mutase